jgi:hypothetical protein
LTSNERLPIACCCLKRWDCYQVATSESALRLLHLLTWCEIYFELMFPTVMPAVLSIHDVVPKVMPQMAALAPATEVPKAIIVFVAIDVCSCQHNRTASDRMRFAILCTTVGICRRSFTDIKAMVSQHGPAPDEPNDQRPLGMIFAVVNWHVPPPFPNAPVCR